MSDPVEHESFSGFHANKWCLRFGKAVSYAPEDALLSLIFESRPPPHSAQMLPHMVSGRGTHKLSGESEVRNAKERSIPQMTVTI